MADVRITKRRAVELLEASAARLPRSGAVVIPSQHGEHTQEVMPLQEAQSLVRLCNACFLRSDGTFRLLLEMNKGDTFRFNVVTP